MEEELWALIQTHFDYKSYSSAAFFADKLVSLTDIKHEMFPEFVYMLATCYYHNGEYPRVCHVLEKFNLINSSLKYQILAAQSMIKAKDFNKTIRILQEPVTEPQTEFRWRALKEYYLGKAYENRESKQLAAESYCNALREDPTCQEAFNALIDSQLLTASQEQELVSNLILPDWLKEYYWGKLKSTRIPCQSVIPFSNNPDILLTKAQQLFYSHKVEAAYEILCNVLRQDPYHLQAVPLHAACMASLGEIGELYSLAHNLVREYSSAPASWYAAGTYYYVIKKYEYSRKFFIKAYKMDKDYLPAWVGYGHTYAAQDQSDQAMSAYRTVARLFPGCHLANLFMGMEYLRTKNLRTALLSFELAKQVCETDPVVWNEIGVVLYRKQDYHKANEVLTQALNLCEGVLSSTTECILFNLAHTFRKLGLFTQAIAHYQQCVQLNPKNASTYSALGLAYYLNNQVHEAADSYNKALFLKSNDRFTNDLLYIALFECADNPPPLL